MPLLRVLPWAIWGTIVLFSVATYGGLPEEIPRKINGAGMVTAAEPRSWFTWMLLPLVAGATQALLTWLGTLLPSQPELFNFPAKERLLKIPAKYRAPVIARMRDVLDIVGAVTMLLMLAVQVGLWVAATGTRTRAMVPMIAIVGVGLVPLTLVLTLRLNRAVDEAERRWRADDPAAPR